MIIFVMFVAYYYWLLYNGILLDCTLHIYVKTIQRGLCRGKNDLIITFIPRINYIDCNHMLVLATW